MTYLTWIVLLGTSLLGSVAGLLGTFAVLRRRALTGDLLSHAALPGLCLAFLLLGRRHFLGMLAGAFVTGLLGVGMITLLARWTRTKADAAIGIVLSTFFAAGIVLSSVIQNRAGGGAKAGLESYIYGSAAGMVLNDLYLIAAVSVAALLVVVTLYKEFKLLSFDPEFAGAQGWPTLALDLVMMGTLALVTVIGLPAVGVVLMAAMLIIPAAAARFWTDRLGTMLALAAVFGAASGAAGTLLSAGVAADWLGFDPLAFGPSRSNLPAGPLIVLCGTAIFVISALIAPRRGVLARLGAETRLRAITAWENLLRTMYELSESRLPERPAIAVEQLVARRAWRPAAARLLLQMAAAGGLVERLPAGARLTERGLVKARQLVRVHRLWELFLIHNAGIAPDHVDRDADTLEHLLTPDLVAEVEERLAAAGTIPASPHALPNQQPDPSPH